MILPTNKKSGKTTFYLGRKAVIQMPNALSVWSFQPGDIYPKTWVSQSFGSVRRQKNWARGLSFNG